jgi:Flp pilus assembly protein TadG
MTAGNAISVSAMPIILFARAIAGAVRRFPAAKDGNIAVIFTIALVPVIAFIGAAIDYSRASKARTSMQAALDSASLMLSKDLANGAITADQIPAKAAAYFNALYTAKGQAPVTQQVTVDYAVANGSTPSSMHLKVSGQIQTDFIKVVNQPTIGFNVSSTAAWGNTRMRVAMVLDNTGSMADNGKMPAMQKAAKDMIDQLSAFNKTTGDVYISIVPFTKDVNVGKSNVAASWINWTEWEAEPPVLTLNSYPINVRFNNITYTWADIGPGAPCPFDTTAVNGITQPSQNSTNSTLQTRGYGFLCMDRPATVSGATDVSTPSASTPSTDRYLIPKNGDYSGMICPGIDSGVNLPGKTGVYYNGCYTSVANAPIINTGSSASCTGKPNCTCTGNHSSKTCTQITYSHYWRSNPSDSNQNLAAAPQHSTWNGCVNDRDQNFDTKNDAPGTNNGTPSSKYYAEQWGSCLAAQVIPMSNNWSNLKTKIGEMVPIGNTNQAIGLAWGWQSLSTINGPILAPPKDQNYIYKDYIVLLSDGLNTQNRWSTTTGSIDTRQQLLCNAIQHDTTNPVTVFTIQVNIASKDPKSLVLQNCATNGNSQMITSSSQTANAFQNIITQISKLRVAK